MSASSRLTGSLVIAFSLVLITASIAKSQEGVRPAMPIETIVAQSSPATVVISISNQDGGGLGSGFLVDELGTIVTNSHVIRDATAGNVTLSNGEVFAGFVVLATDEQRDLAIIRIAGFNLPYLSLGNSDSVRIGQEITVIGAPYGLQATVSTGIVSALREVEGSRLIQLTAPISPGSSGGPIISREGQVLAVATAQLEEGQNLNFAVPINYARGLLLAPRGELFSVPPLTEESAISVVERVNAALHIQVGRFQELRATLENSLTDNSEISVRVFDPEGPDAVRVEVREEGENYYYRLVADPSTFTPLSLDMRATFESDDIVYSQYADLSFDQGSVDGTVKPFDGPERRISRTLPEGIILGGWTDTNNWTVFFFLDGDVNVGQTYVITSYDPFDNVIRDMQFDVIGKENIKVDGTRYEALVVDVTDGDGRTRAYFRSEQPHVILRFEGRTDDWEGNLKDIILY